MGFPSLGGWDGPAPSFQSQRLKVGGSAARWVFVVTTILDSLQMCCLVRIAHYVNEPRQERMFPDKSVVGYPLVRKRLARQEVAIVVVNKAIFALENWPNGSVSAIGMFSPTMRGNHLRGLQLPDMT
jgi:hypothetical protein